jgi:ABC-type sugar transport system ATPase subunit
LLQRDVGPAMLYASHDQAEAMTMSDNLAVMRGGLVEQAGKLLRECLSW